MKKTTIKLFLVLLIFVMAFAFFTACSDKEGGIITNSDFEKGKGSSINGWKLYNYHKDYENDSSRTQISLVDMGFDGKCVKIESKGDNDARIYQEIPVEENAKYKVQFDALYENISKGASDTGAGLNISTKEGSGVSERTGGLFGTIEKWHTITAYFTTEDRMESVELTIGIGGYGAESSGTVYIDNVKVEEVKSIPEGESVFAAKGEIDTSASIWFKLIFVLLTAATVVLVIFVCIKADNENAAKLKTLSQKNPILGKNDLIILLVMVTVCSVMSFWDLGNAYGPENFWKAEKQGEYVVVEFEKETEVSRIAYLSNIPQSGSYSVYYENSETGEFEKLQTIKQGTFFEWEFEDKTFKTKKVKVVADVPGLAVNELGFFSKNAQGKYERVKLSVKETDYDSNLNKDSNPEMLFDEQDMVEPYSSYRSSTYFDEIYFPRTAYESINGYDIYEVTHPPMGKNIMALGVQIFGMNPFGWRFMGTLFGVGLVPLMYLLALKVFKKRTYAFAAAFLMMFDFMRLAQTRLATIDSYSAFFILCMYYFMYDYFTQKSYEKKSFMKSLKPLLLSGIMFGLGASTKWVCIYTGVGLAIMFFLAKYLEFNDVLKDRVPGYTKKTWFVCNFLPTCGMCVIFFIVIPLVIYTLSYIPYMASTDKSLIQIVIDNQEYMYEYHSDLTAEHSYGSAWYTWPINLRPIYYYSGSQANLPNGIDTSIVSMGNPLVWWTGLACIFPAAFYALKKRDKGMMMAFIGYAVQFLPWVLVTRVCFIYHYFTAVPFMIFMIVYVIKNLLEDRVISKHLVWIYLALVLLLFIMFYPVLTAREVSREYINSLRWFSTWSF
ncbi:MAG: phospholipid carrier-dependent glycosyltransferase [Ruminococcaceae bacterium]|nr:phospholipid carrier-dependent glycosyltransferase [Oscillospiraceae bacterium]